MTKRFTKDDIDEVVFILQNGGTVAFPTDTVYGLGVIYDDENALQRLKEAKGRPENKPIPTMVANMKQLCHIAEVNQSAQTLATAFMPGALTLILKKKDTVADYVTNGLPNIAVRMPNDAFVLALLEKCQKPMLVTSANISGEEPGKNTEQVLAQLAGRIDAIVIGEAKGTTASTIVDVSDDEIKIVRTGVIDEKAIQSVLTKF